MIAHSYSECSSHDGTVRVYVPYEYVVAIVRIPSCYIFSTIFRHFQSCQCTIASYQQGLRKVSLTVPLVLTVTSMKMAQVPASLFHPPHSPFHSKSATIIGYSKNTTSCTLPFQLLLHGFATPQCQNHIETHFLPNPFVKHATLQDCD